jgi:hypothetical protein
MGTTETIALVTIVHQPDERLAGMIDTHQAGLAARYAAWVAFCSRDTHPAILDRLRGSGATVHVDHDEPSGIHGIGRVRRKALRAGLLAGTSHFQMCDFDRALHWVAHYPRELESIIASIPDFDLLVLGRTERAWATHPPYQAETEPLFNHVFALVTGLPWDVGAGSRGISRRAAEVLLQHSRVAHVGLDAEWPLLLLNRPGFRVGYRACEGLEFETADRYRPEIEAAGGYQAWQAQASADPKQWLFRLQVALLIAETAVHTPASGDPQEPPGNPTK